jgi:L-ascorbate metabolism protein UlaG (beta-lactamase superfamily)
MLRYPIAFLAALAVAAAAPAQEKKLTIRWHGQSFFEIVSSAGTRVVIDPHAIEEFGEQSVHADLILFSHFHSDHTQFHVVPEWARDPGKVKVLGGLKDEKGDRKHVTWNNLDEKFRDVRVRSVGTYHDTEEGKKRGLNSVLMIEVDGYRLVHLGDLGHLLSAAQVKAIGTVDVLMIPVGGVYTLNGSDAKEVVAQLKPRYYVLPMHYGIPRVYEDLLNADEFLEDQKNVKKAPSNQLALPLGMKPPAEPTIVLLHWTDK